MFSSVLTWMVSGPKGLSDTDKALDELCRPPRDKNTNARQRIPDSKFRDISDVLKHYGALKKTQGWHLRPRIYTVLHQIGRLDVMGGFLSAGLTDSCIPFGGNDLPDQLRESKRRFIQFQDYVLTTAKDLELGIEGRHRFLDPTGDDHFWNLGLLGSGGSGDVDKVLSRLSLKPYARKKFRRAGTTREWVSRHKQFEREITALKRLRHTHLVEIVGSYSDRRCLAFLMTPVADCNLLAFLQERVTYDRSPTLRSFYGCLASTMAYLHSKNVYHMDLKPENVLIKNGEPYVADFGSSHDRSKQEPGNTHTDTPRTIRYQPPELARNPHAVRNWATDMWSLGVVFLEMTTVLRGQSIQAFRAHLIKNGTTRPYVFDNAPATASWTEILRASEGPGYDNEPLMWIYGMTRLQADSRPRASKVMELILDSSAGEQFRRSCCSVPHHEAPDDALNPDGEWQSNGKDDNEVELRLLQALFASDQVTNSLPYQDASKTRSIEAWMDGGDTPNDQGIWPTADPSLEAEGLPFDISEDGANATRSQPAIVSTIPQRLGDVNLLQQPNDIPGAWEDWNDTEDNSLAYDVTTDDADSVTSEVTIKPTTSGRKEPVSVTEGGKASLVDGKSQQGSLASTDPPKRIPLNSSTRGVFFQQNGAPGPLPYTFPASVQSAHAVGNRQQILTAGSQREVQEARNQRETQKARIQKETQIAGSQKETQKPGNQKGTQKARNQKDMQKADASLQGKPTDNNGPPAGHKLKALGTGTDPQSKILQDQPNRPRTEGSGPLSTANLSLLKAANAERRSALVPKVERRSVVLSRNDGQQTLRDVHSKDLRDSQPCSTSSTHTKRKAMFSAEEYIQNIWVAESSAATSVVSSNTSRKLQVGMGGSAWQDRSFNYVGHYAREGSAGALRMLLQKGCNPGTRIKPRPGPMIFAARGATGRHVKCAKVLLEFGADPNTRQSGTGKTPLHFAIENPYFQGYGNLVFELLQNGADPNTKDASGEYPIHKILFGFDRLEKHRRDALALLLYYGADVDVAPPGTQNEPIHLAVTRKDPWAVGMLLAKGASADKPNGAGVTPLGLAVGAWGSTMTKDDAEVAGQLLDRGAAVNQRIGSLGLTALHHAVQHGKVDMVQTLLRSYGADVWIVDKGNRRPIDFAKPGIESRPISHDTHANMMKLLLQAEGLSVPSAKGACAVVTALKNSDEIILSKLIKTGAGVNRRYGGRLLLIMACAESNEPIVRFLTLQGAFMDLKDQEGKTAQGVARQMGHASIEKYLRQEGNVQAASKQR